MDQKQEMHEIPSLVKIYTVVPGLVLATIGGYLAFTGGFSMVWNKWLYPMLFNSMKDSWLANLAALGSLILPVALYLVVLNAVVRYYKQHFGQVKPRSEEKSKLTAELVGGGIAYFFIGQTFDTHMHSAVSVTLLIFALFLLVHWRLFARRQIHYLLLAIIAIALSVVPLFSSAVYYWLYSKYTSPDWYGFNIAVCSGLLLLIAGLLDHWYMVRMFARVRKHVLTNSFNVSDSIDTKAAMEDL